MADLPEPGETAVSAQLLRARIALTRLLITASIALLAACTNDGSVNWHVVQTTDTPAPSSSVCPAGATLNPPPGCGPSSTPAPLPAGPDRHGYVPSCLPSDPPGSYCQAPQ